MKVFYFTATGNNLYLAKSLGDQLYSIPRLLKEGTLEFTDDCMGIIFPCYYFGTPGIVKEFIKKANLKSDYIFAIMSYGSFPFGGVNHFMKLVKRAGVNISYLNQISMLDNYVPLFDIEKQKNRIDKREIEKNLANIKADISVRKKFIKRKFVLNNLATFLAQSYFKIKLKRADRQFFIEDTCNSCKVCEQVCPVDNIKVDKMPVYLHNCIECLACTHACLQGAIGVKGEKSRERYLNEHVSLNEIIEANQ